jgi:tetratricopeptide (TPR) repeat protein
MERYDEAVALQRRAQELDPLAHRVDVANALLRAGRRTEALEAATQAVTFEPGYARGHATRGWVLMRSGRTDEGIAELERAVSLAPEETVWLAQLGQACGEAGRVERAREILDQLQERSQGGYVSPYHFAYVHTGLNQYDRAVDYLERAYAQRAGSVYGIKGSFLFTHLRSHPRFRALLRKMRLA